MCVNGTCQAYLLITAPGPVTTLGSDGTNLYFGYSNSESDSALLQLPLDNTQGLSTIAMPSEAFYLVVDGTKLFWYDNVAKQIVTYSAGAAAVKVYDAPNTLSDMHVQGADLYWYTAVGDLFWSGPKSGTPMPSSFDAQAGLGLNHFGIDGSFVYRPSMSAIDKRPIPFDMASAWTQIIPTSAVSNITADADPNGYVYFSTAGQIGGVFQVKKDGSTPSSNAQIANANYTDALLVDGSFVYWTNFLAGKCTGAGALGARSLAGNTEVQLALLPTCGPVAQDMSALYYAAGKDIYRIVKPSP